MHKEASAAGVSLAPGIAPWPAPPVSILRTVGKSHLLYIYFGREHCTTHVQCGMLSFRPS